MKFKIKRGLGMCGSTFLYIEIDDLMINYTPILIVDAQQCV